MSWRFRAWGTHGVIILACVCFCSPHAAAQEPASGLTPAVGAQPSAADAEGDIQPQWPLSLRVGFSVSINPSDASEGVGSELVGLSHGDGSRPVGMSVEVAYPLPYGFELRAELGVRRRLWPRPNPETTHLSVGDFVLGAGYRLHVGNRFHFGLVVAAGAALAGFRFIETTQYSAHLRVQGGGWIGTPVAERALIYIRATGELLTLRDVAGPDNHLGLGGLWVSIGIEVGRDS